MVINKQIYFINLMLKYTKNYMGIGDWGLGIGDWGLGFGAKTPKPKTQTPNPKKK